MSSLTIEHFAIPTTGRQARRLDDVRARAADALADRAVWWWADGGGHPEDPVCAHDVVVLRERPEPDLMQALRELGAHVVWHIERRPPEPARAVDAYVMTWDHGFAALMPCAGILVAKDLDARLDDELGWTSLLADVVHSDREETVGGTLHVRPLVAAR
jgi:hypothetical protein